MSNPFESGFIPGASPMPPGPPPMPEQYQTIMPPSGPVQRCQTQMIPEDPMWSATGMFGEGARLPPPTAGIVVPGPPTMSPQCQTIMHGAPPFQPPTGPPLYQTLSPSRPPYPYVGIPPYQPAATPCEAAAAHEVSDRLNMALDKHNELSGTLHQLTRGGYTGYHQQHSLVRKANLDGVDWRVARLNYCKDPYYNQYTDPASMFETQQRKMKDAEMLQDELSREASQDWAKRLYGENAKNVIPSVPYMDATPAVPFMQCHPNYSVCEDVWGRKLELRSLGEAMDGDVSKPLPRPVLFDEDYSDFRSGKYLKDDCPIA